MALNRGELIVQQTYPEDEFSWYVHRVELIDMGRFRTEKEAKEHRAFLVERNDPYLY